MLNCALLRDGSAVYINNVTFTYGLSETNERESEGLKIAHKSFLSFFLSFFKKQPCVY